MASTAVTTRAYPKRKRAEISYHESSSDESEVDDGYRTSDEKLPTMTKKVRWSILVVFANQMSSNSLL